MHYFIKNISIFLSFTCCVAVLLSACKFESNYIPATAESIWVDVRTKDEFERGHIENSLNIPYDIITQKTEQITSDKSADIRVYCRSGRRSGIAQKKLQQMGYNHVINEGGYKDILKKREKAARK